MSLHGWSWLFLAAYVVVMAAFGVLGGRRVANADDFATARGGYGPLILALAFASTAASGATFLGLPGLTYTYGLSTLWIAFLYPLGLYTGILICQRTIGRYGNLAGARSIPEYLGERYQSEGLRLSAAVFSLILLFYLAGQLVAGLIMFEMMLGLSQATALTITTAVLLGYVTLGGAHADILTDGAQGLLMVVLAVAILIMFLLGAGNGGLSELLASLRAQDPQLVEPLHPGAAITASVWAFVSLTIAHIPLGLLPHIGNKLWAIKNERSRSQFVILAFTFGIVLPAITLGGALARGRLGGSLFEAGGANTALPALFIDLFPTWLAALLGVGILSAVMSTADGLVISTSQVFANDIYRRSLAPRLHKSLDRGALDRNVLLISRVVTTLTLLGSAVLAWFVMDMNVVLLVWVGIGGFTAALAGPLVLGSVWRGVTRAGALAGFWAGAVTFVAIHGEFVSGLWLEGTALETFGRWFAFNAASPYSAATLGGLTSVAVTVAVSWRTQPLPDAHLVRVLSGR
ncbi:MAG: sodium:pantothenate symporter [Gammaproteobacteria bacterium]|nr:sodium:pantothenate symporter [Gammaproteobacteria bacterium]